jgi:hypothetical protein
MNVDGRLTCASAVAVAAVFAGAAMGCSAEALTIVTIARGMSP